MNRLKLMIPVMLLACACARGTSAQTATPAVATSQADSVRHALVPPGFGTLKQDEFSIGLRSGTALLVKVTPLSERIIRLAAPDTYTRLHALADSRRADAAERTRSKEPELFLVSFFSYQPDVTFQPEDLQIEYNGKLLRAGLIVPLTPGWGRGTMGQQETQAAIYAFGEPIDYQQPIVVRYGMDQNSEWQRIIPKLEVERSKALSKVTKE